MTGNTNSNRIASIDIFRALTMLTMLFVNDFSGMGGIPHWLCHAETNEDMMGFSDLVFPAFLFCMGLSIPFAVTSRERKGDSLMQVGIHIVLRSLALIIMGLFAMNCSSIEGVMSTQVFQILMVLGFFMVWNCYPKAGGMKKIIFTILQIVGVVLLLALMTLRVANGHPIKTGWWGILGLIGWAYLFSSIIYLFFRKIRCGIYVAWVAVIALVLINNAGIHILGTIPGGWTHVGLAFSGVAVSSMMVSLKAADKKPETFSKVALALSAVMLGLGIVSHQFWINSKNLATPTWMFFSLMCSLAFMALFYYIADVKKISIMGNNVAKVILLPAGVSTLTCYTLPYLTYSIRQILHIYYPHVLSYGIIGLLKSLVFSIVIIIIAGLLSKINVKLKL